MKFLTQTELIVFALIVGMIFNAPLYYGIILTIAATISLAFDFSETYQLWKTLRRMQTS